MNPLVGIIMGSKSDWETLSHAADMLDTLGVPYEARVCSAHRTPDAIFEYASTAELRGLGCIIAGAGAAAHLAGVTAAKTMLPVLGVPIESGALKGLDALLSTVQMPGGVPVATFAIGKPGAINAAIYAASILGTKDSKYREAVRKYREGRTKALLADSDPRKPSKPA
jgi:5-(carboxyamino)imidazole ribonucleotide mutase